MRLFGKKKSTTYPATEVAAQRLADRIRAQQRALADYLNFRTRHFTAHFWRCAVIAFSISFGGYCIYLVVSAIN